MGNEGVTSTAGTDDEVIDPTQPAPGADEKKPTPTEGDGSSESAVETTEQQEAKKQSKFQRRLDRQKTARVAAETEARLLREQLTKLEAQPKPSQETGEPKREDFESLEDYLKAVSKHEAAQLIEGRLKTEREERAKQESTSRATVSEARVAKDWTERETAFQTANKDYQEAVTSYIKDEVGQLSDVARRSILESEVGPQVLYHLAKNPDEAERIADLSPVRQIAELGKLEVKFAPAARKASSAPAPITPVGSSSSTSSKKLGEMNQDEFEKKRKAQIAARR